MRLLVLVLFTAFAHTAVSSGDTGRQMEELVEKRDFTAAIAELQALKGRDEKLFVSSNYDYLLARVAEIDDQTGLAFGGYLSVARSDSPLSPYALAHLAQMSRSTGNLLLERIYLNEIAMRWPDSLAAGDVAFRMAENAFESGNYREAIRILKAPPSQVRSSKPSAPPNLARDREAFLAEAYVGLGDHAQARRIFTALLDNMPNAGQPDDAALRAVRALDRVELGTNDSAKKMPELTEAEHFRRGNVYQFNRDFTDARLHFEAVLARFGGGQSAVDSILALARGYAQLRDHAEALKWYERLLEQFPEDPAVKDALLQSAAAYSRVGKAKEALTRYQTYIDKYPTEEKLDRAYLNMVDVLRDQGADQDALKWCAKTRDAFPGKVPAALATFAAARIYIAREEWQEALGEIENLTQYADLGGASVPGGTTRAEVAFLKAYCLEQQKSYAEAIDAYLAINDGRNEYYGWRATESLKTLATAENSGTFVTQKVGQLSAAKPKDTDGRRKNAMALLRLSDLPAVREKALAELRSAITASPAYAKLPAVRPLPDLASKGGNTHRQIAETFITLGLYDEAARELDAAGADAAAVADAYKKGDGGNRAIAFVEPLWRKMPADYPIDLIPREHLELLYPAPFKDELIAAAAKDGVDPRLMLAIMRQESRFAPDARSDASARGLMQFISTTSTQVAGELNIKGFVQDDLYYPPTSILFGSKYLADLFGKFPGQPDAVVASYNGGDDNVKRWVARSRTYQPERYVPEIAFAQSKDYVYKVMSSYRMYQFLYDGELRKK